MRLKPSADVCINRHTGYRQADKTGQTPGDSSEQSCYLLRGAEDLPGHVVGNERSLCSQPLLAANVPVLIDRQDS